MRYSKIIGYIIATALVLFVVRMFIDNLSMVEGYKYNFQIWPLIISSLLFYIHILMLAWIWKELLKKIDEAIILDNFTSAKIVVYTRLGKYVPGKIWGVTGRMYFLNKMKHPNKPVFTSLVYEMLFSIFSSIILGVLLMTYSLELDRSYFVVLLATFIFLVFFVLGQNVVNKSFAIIVKKIYKQNIESNMLLDTKNSIKFFTYILVAQLINGLAFYVFLLSFVLDGFSLSILTGTAGAYLFSGTVGMLAFFVPAGIGVREGTLIAFLVNIFDEGVAALITISSRIWNIANELFLFLIYFIFSKIHERFFQARGNQRSL